MNNVMANTCTISPHEVNDSLDILCGRDRRSYNHTANRRFRFLMALNLERYRDIESRKAKSLVVQSLYRQIREAGGRFLGKRHTDDALVLVTDKAAKKKISHALRDKFPKSILRAIKAKLRRSCSSSRLDENLLVLNAVLLQVSLPDAHHASDHHVEQILTAELERIMFNGEVSTRITQLEMMTQSSSTLGLPKTVPPSFTHICDSVINSSICSSALIFHDKQTVSSAVFNKHTNRVVGFDTLTSSRAINVSHEPGLLTPLELLPNIEGTRIQIDSMKCTEKIAEDIGDFDVGEDLPQNFTEKDCEDLVNMLDFVSAE